MNVKDFLDKVIGFLPTFRKRDLNQQIQALEKELKETTIPLFEALHEDYRNWEFTSSEVKRMIPTFNSIVKVRKGNIFTSVYVILKNVQATLDKAAPMFDKSFTELTTSTNLTMNQAQKLKFIETLYDIVRYARKWANYVLVAETAKYDPAYPLSKVLTPKQRKDVEEEFSRFCLMLNVLTDKPEVIIKKLQETPDIEISLESIDTVSAIKGVSSVDKFRMFWYSPRVNPFFFIGMKRAEAQIKRYEEAKADVEMLHLRILNLKQLAANEPSPAIQKQIEYNESRVQKLECDIEDFENEYLN